MEAVEEGAGHEWKPGQVFVFGSNLSGRHGRGAALFARINCGAKYGQASGRQGQSYAIPTKDTHLAPLSPATIKANVTKFIAYAKWHPHETFFVTAIGTGLAGYTDEQIAPMFAGAPENCILPPKWR